MMLPQRPSSRRHFLICSIDNQCGGARPLSHMVIAIFFCSFGIPVNYMVICLLHCGDFLMARNDKTMYYIVNKGALMECGIPKASALNSWPTGRVLYKIVLEDSTGLTKARSITLTPFGLFALVLTTKFLCLTMLRNTLPHQESA
jgi:hypothetical protein